MHHFAQGKSFDDFEPYLGNSKHASRTPVTLENNVSKSLAADNVKASNAAKIKVEVRKRPLNKEELMKNEEDIIETHFNSLIVQEIKLKELQSTTQHLSSALPPTETFEDDMGGSWPERTDNESYDEDSYEQEKPSRKNSKVEAYNFSYSEDKTRTNG
ncbi:kinesin-like protein KIN-13B isoform X1 [Olea europaea var. sylvestris]|uniref:kinesin-like protein KIN-13B isoform X1 n=1 Tax=Olea europaea var. sylvestris TaxID=158386 RepID=UPI000C1D0025|nr:kinesin-like protein KIN-13B isoform X1 [Olea europaea var. sylvestris]XP_022889666.1 kinesin-like protein KIN-13B isoform X1 [Olea europaea var. sylvestris]